MRFFDPREALLHVPAFRGATVEVERELNGLGNRSFLVRRGTERFVMRLDSLQTAVFDVDRINELLVLDRAAQQGIGPDIVFADPGTGILVTRFLPGRTLAPGDLDNNRVVDEVADLLRRVHGLERCGRRLDLPGAARRYASSLHAGGEIVRRCERILADVPTADRVVLCHNDVIADNLITGDGLHLIDWEYARDNDPLFDVATLVAYHDLAPERARALLSAYSGRPGAESSERLTDLVRKYDALHWLWLAARDAVRPDPGQRQKMATLEQRIA